mmetsp:Transcript_7605/g.31660  ORF Transcript_7605/g.31660 Transcript_7605/m.31660 type:complete len:432 (-) Transcript_7605:519-1814(-)
MNENRERGHGSAQLLAVALSSQNVSRVASVARKRACFSFSNARRRFSVFRETSSSKAVSFASFVARRRATNASSAARGATTLQNSVSAPPGMSFSAFGSRVQSSFVGSTDGSEEADDFSFASPDAPLAEEENVGGSLGPSVVFPGFVSRRTRAPQSTRAGSDPDGTRTTPSPFAKPADPASAEVSTLSQCLAAIVLKFAYMRAPCGSEHTLSGWNCTPKCGRVTCSSAITAPPARSSEMSSAVTHSLTNKPSSFSESESYVFVSASPPPPFFLSSRVHASVHAVARRTPAPSFVRDAASTTRLWYRVCLKTRGTFVNKSHVPSCVMFVTRPCVGARALRTSTPCAAANSWWPRQTPQRGVLQACRTMSKHTPTSRSSYGLPGPGERTIREKCRVLTETANSAQVYSSLRTTIGGVSSIVAMRWYRLYVYES